MVKESSAGVQRMLWGCVVGDERLVTIYPDDVNMRRDIAIRYLHA